MSEATDPMRRGGEPPEERLPTWREFLFRLHPEQREEFQQMGPAAVLSLYRALEFPQPFLRWADPLPGETVKKSTVRNPDGTEREVVRRWVKLESPWRGGPTIP